MSNRIKKKSPKLFFRSNNYQNWFTSLEGEDHEILLINKEGAGR